MTATTVRCSVCGKKLKGQPSVTGGYSVNFHRGYDSKPCPGKNTNAHRPVVKRP